MRRILVDRAREKSAEKSGGHHQRVDSKKTFAVVDGDADRLLAIHEALAELEKQDAEAAKLVKLRYFAGFTHKDAVEAMRLGRRSADRLWMLARTWLHRHFADS